MKYLPAVIFISLVLIYGCRSLPAAVNGGWTDSYIEMLDSGAVYDVWLMARVDALKCPDSLNIDVRIISPDGIGSASDTFTMPTNMELIDSLADNRLRYVMSVFSRDIESLYRTGIQPVQYGRWIISCRAGDPSVKCIRARVGKQAQ